MQALLPWSLIEALVAQGLVPSDRFRVLLEGSELPRASYCDAAGKPLPDVVQDLAAQGATLAINAIEVLVPALGRLAATLERQSRCKVGINCYLSFGTGSAFIPHSDAHDVLVLQLYGSKSWRRFGIPYAFPIPGLPRRPAVQEPVWVGDMTPGDLLFLPRGEVHAATPIDGPSVHLTFGLYEPTGIDVLQWLATRAGEVEALRRGLGPRLTGQARKQRTEAMVSALHALVDDASIEAFLAETDLARRVRPLAPLGRVRGTVAPFAAETLLSSALRRPVDLRIGQQGQVLLTLGSRRLRLSQAARRALAEINGHEAMTVAALAKALGTDPMDSGLVASLDELVRKALIAAED